MSDTYKLTEDGGSVLKIYEKNGQTNTDIIPVDWKNADYQAFQKWEAAGNTPLPHDAPVEKTDEQQVVEEVSKAIDFHKFLDAYFTGQDGDSKKMDDLKAQWKGIKDEVAAEAVQIDPIEQVKG